MQTFLKLDERPSEETIIKSGYRQLSGEALKQKIVGKVVWGNYLYGYTFITIMNPNGTMEGKNNAGAHHFGEWSIDMAENSLTIAWDWGWANTTTRAYDVDGEIWFYDCATGQWCTSFTKIEAGDVGTPLQI